MRAREREGEEESERDDGRLLATMNKYESDLSRCEPSSADTMNRALPHGALHTHTPMNTPTHTHTHTHIHAHTQTPTQCAHTLTHSVHTHTQWALQTYTHTCDYRSLRLRVSALCYQPGAAGPPEPRRCRVGKHFHRGCHFRPVEGKHSLPWSSR